MSQLQMVNALKQCCYRSAMHANAGYCEECGQPLLRCAAFEECGGLLAKDGHCAVCFAPQLFLQPGIQEVAVGGTLVLNLELHNAATIGRPLFVKGFWTRTAKGEWKSVDLTWDRLEAGAAGPLSVTADDLDKPGVHEVEVLIAVASRYRWREEVLAFATQLCINVEEKQSIQQNINYSSDGPQTGVTIYAPVSGRTEQRRLSSSQKSQLELVHASVLERQLSLRGYNDAPERSMSLSRATQIEWNGFAKATAPSDGAIVTQDGQLKAGRARCCAQGGTNNLRLLVTNPNGSVDEVSSRGISREHFSLYIENGRLMLHSKSGSGVWLDGDVVQRGESRAIGHGSVVSPLVGSPRQLAVRFEFETEHDQVVRVLAVRQPNVSGA